VNGLPLHQSDLLTRLAPNNFAAMFAFPAES